MKIPHIVEMILHKELDKGKFMCLKWIVYKLINYLILNYLRLIYAKFLTSFLTAVFTFLSTWLLIITSTSDLQPRMVIANKLPGQLVSTQIRTRGPNCFKFIIPLIMTSTNIV